LFGSELELVPATVCLLFAQNVLVFCTYTKFLYFLLLHKLNAFNRYGTAWSILC